MQSKISLFNRGLFIQGLRNVGWISLLYFLCLLFALPLQLLMRYTNKERYYYYYTHLENLFDVFEGFQILLMFAVPVLLAIFLFRFMQVKLSADFIHSLPIRRETIFHQHILLGLLLLLLPILLSGAVLAILGGVFNTEEILSATSILHWMGMTSLITIFVFFAGVVVAMFTGMSALQGVLTYIMLLFPAGITILFVMNLKPYLYGFAADYYLSTNIERMIPFVRASELSRSPFTWQEVVLYLLFSIGFYVVALIVYKKRNVEAATQAIAFKSLKPIFKYGVAFCCMLIGGFYFSETQGDIGWIVFGYFVTSLLGYFVAEMLLQKTWRVFANWKGYLVFAISIGITGFIIQFDITGYEKKIPPLEDIERIYFGHSVYMIKGEDMYWNNDEREDLRPNYYLQELNNIENIQQLHKQLVEERPKSRYHGQLMPIVIGYELTNGKMVVRRYDVQVKDYEQLYKPIVESREYKQGQNPLLRVNDLSDLDRIIISSHRSIEKRVIINDPEKMKEFHAMLQDDIVEETYDEEIERYGSWAEIDYKWQNEKSTRAVWYKSYHHIEEWLEQNGLVDQARITAKDVAYAVVIKNENEKLLHEFMGSIEEMEGLKNRQDVLLIKDDDQLDEALKQASWNDQGKYVIGFYFNDSSFPELQTFSEDQVPAFIKEQF
ncbi:DUF6449 domain-containing protein [Anaerobacillus sp. MEB173]|uniref:DUF6449 domain-containing protein n=1 Tax=Anaerobacillus sp. MEB173 TaxID=3383345 RepID=UPI003F930515